MANKPIQQHWVPKVYLRSFCLQPVNGEQIHVRDVTTGKNFVTSIDRIAKARHFYTLACGTEDQSFAVEEALSVIESSFSGILLKMQTCQELPADPESMATLTQFIATLHMRTRQGMQMVYGCREEIRSKMRISGMATNGNSIKNIIEFDDTEMRELFAKSAVVVGCRIAEALRGMHWRLLRATDSYFITSENPVISFHRSARQWGLGTPGARTFFPVSPSLLIHLSHERDIPGKGTFDLPRESVRGLNGLTLLGAKQYIYSHRPFDELSDLVKEREPGSVCAFGPPIF